jgi:hypothetical protein
VSDFYQTGVVATLHRLAPDGLDRLECELTAFSSTRPIALLLPALYREFEGPAMPKIIEELRNVPYLRQIVIALGGASPEQYDHAQSMAAGLRPEVRFIWINGERIQGLYKRLCDNGLPLAVDGKGRCQVQFPVGWPPRLPASCVERVSELLSAMSAASLQVPQPQDLPNEQGCCSKDKQTKSGHHPSEGKHRQGPDCASDQRPQVRPAKTVLAMLREALGDKHAYAEARGRHDRSCERDCERRRHRRTRHADQDGDKPDCERDDSAQQ